MSAFEVDTASNYLDLLDKIVTFLSATLTPSGERWTVLRYTGVDSITSSSDRTGYEDWMVIKGPYAMHSGNSWRTAVGQHANCWLAFHLVTALDIRRLTITGSDTTSMSPSTFSLDYSADGVSWTTLQTWTSQTFTAGQQREFAVTATSPGAQSYWRLYVTSNAGHADTTEIKTIQFPAWQTTADFNHARLASAWLKAPGLTGTDPVYVNLAAYSRPGSDYYNLAITAGTGFVEAYDFDTQPGCVTALGLPLWNSSIPYWLAADGQHLAISVRVDNYGHGAWVGKILTFGTPSQYPYPALVAAPFATALGEKYNSANAGLPFVGNSGRMKLRNTAGTWAQPWAWPWWQNPSSYSARKDFKDTGGQYGLLPITLYDASNLLGILQDVRYLTGFGMAVQNMISVGSESWLALNAGTETGMDDWYAQRYA